MRGRLLLAPGPADSTRIRDQASSENVPDRPLNSSSPSYSNFAMSVVAPAPIVPRDKVEVKVKGQR